MSLVNAAAGMPNIDRDTNHRSYEDIPEDLWIEILVRLSVESLQQIRCICTLWYRIVNNGSFAKKHLEFQKKIYNNKNEGFLLRYNLYNLFHAKVERPKYLLFDANGTNLSSSSTILLDPALHKPYCESLCFLGPVNGLYCVYSDIPNFIIWNPATKEVGFLPSIAELLPTTDSLANPLIIYGDLCGFGVDPLNEQDYKLLLIYRYGSPRGYDGGESFSRMLYTTSTNRWRLVDHDIGFVEYIPPWKYSSNSTYLNGFYYWWVSYEGVLLVFDMGQNENFHTICGPDSTNDRDSEIVLHNDHISLIIVNDTPCEIEIWVLDEEVSKWTKTTCVRGVQRPLYEIFGFCGNNDDQLLLLVEDPEPKNPEFHLQTVLYNTNTQKVERDIGPPGLALSRVSLGCESIISLSKMGMTTYRGNHASSTNAISRFLFESRDTKQIDQL